MNRKIEKYIVSFTILIAFFFILLSIIDFLSMMGEMDVIRKVYHINADSNHLQFQTELNFVLWRVFQFFLGLFIFWLGILILKPSPSKWSRYTFYMITVLVLIWQIRYYFLWIQSGFDHYPGFDPYLL